MALLTPLSYKDPLSGLIFLSQSLAHRMNDDAKIAIKFSCSWSNLYTMATQTYQPFFCPRESFLEKMGLSESLFSLLFVVSIFICTIGR